MRRHVSFNKKEEESAYVQLLLLLQSIVHLACLSVCYGRCRLIASHLHGFSEIYNFCTAAGDLYSGFLLCFSAMR